MRGSYVETETLAEVEAWRPRRGICEGAFALRSESRGPAKSRVCAAPRGAVWHHADGKCCVADWGLCGTTRNQKGRKMARWSKLFRFLCHMPSGAAGSVNDAINVSVFDENGVLASPRGLNAYSTVLRL